MNFSIANRKYEFRVRDGIASTPTAGSTLLATGEENISAASIIGRSTVHVEGTLTVGSSGTHTSGCFTVATDTADGVRPEARRVGNEGVRKCRDRGSPYHYKNKTSHLANKQK